MGDMEANLNLVNSSGVAVTRMFGAEGNIGPYRTCRLVDDGVGRGRVGHRSYLCI